MYGCSLWVGFDSLVLQLSAAEGKSHALEEELSPLKENIRQLTAQKDSLIAESTALKNEVVF